MFNAEQMAKIEKATEGSAIWKEINAKVKTLYKEWNRIPSEEEYQALRNVIFCKAVLEDSNLFKVMSDNVWETLQA